MSEMKKRVAKAMADRFLEMFANEAAAGRYDGDQGEVRVIVDGKWIDLVALADAAMEAMREPTQAIIYDYAEIKRRMDQLANGPEPLLSWPACEAVEHSDGWFRITVPVVNRVHILSEQGKEFMKRHGGSDAA